MRALCLMMLIAVGLLCRNLPAPQFCFYMTSDQAHNRQAIMSAVAACSLLATASNLDLGMHKTFGPSLPSRMYAK